MASSYTAMPKFAGHSGCAVHTVQVRSRAIMLRYSTVVLARCELKLKARQIGVVSPNLLMREPPAAGNLARNQTVLHSGARLMRYV